ncbi:hypothetical protein DFH29DRAFT_403930 [Suillus ampliporus]|nr:hypothetical protein DFH29DRAFT_403930 [Suillus ampliporus]
MANGQIGAFLQSSGCCDMQLVVFDNQSQRNLETKLLVRMTRSLSSHGNGGGSMCLSLRQSKDCSPQQHVDDALRAVTAMTPLTQKGGVQGDTEPLSVQDLKVFVADAADAFQLLLSRITTFVKIARVFAEAHPYTKMALMVLTAGHEVIQRQLARDDSI